MIISRFIRHFSTTGLARLSIGSSLSNNQHQIDKTAETKAPTSSLVDQADQKDDDLYRHLWLRCRAHEIQVLDSYEKFLKMAAEHLDISHVRTETPFRIIKRKTMLASRFVKKKYRVQYEVRTYHRDLLFKNLTGSTADTYLEYVQRNLPEGVMMIVEKHRLAKLPFDLTDNQVQED